MPDDAALDPGPETVYLGRFDPIELPIILEALRDRGIFAMTKSPLDQGESAPYTAIDYGREILIVERGRAEEARKIIDDEVRAQISEMREALDADVGTSPEAEGLAPFGWLEPEVARELLAQLADVEIRAEPEYPLDAPAPAYARADGRVRVHVEELFLDDAAEILRTDVREALVARGFAPAEPLLGDDL